MYAHLVYLALKEAEEEIKPPNARVIGSCESQNVRTKPVCSLEQQVLLTTETSLQPSYPPTSTYTQIMHRQ